jgi:electron transfer flavoprotein alpha subunit
MTEYQGVMVLGESNDGHLKPITTELLGCGRRLAGALQEKLSAIIIGGKIDGLAAEAACYGADRVYEVQDPLLEDYLTESYATLMATLVDKVKPRILLMGQTTIGRDLAPRLAFRLQTAAAMDCIELAIDETSKHCCKPGRFSAAMHP